MSLIIDEYGIIKFIYLFRIQWVGIKNKQSSGLVGYKGGRKPSYTVFCHRNFQLYIIIGQLTYLLNNNQEDLKMERESNYEFIKLKDFFTLEELMDTYQKSYDEGIPMDELIAKKLNKGEELKPPLD